MVLEEYGVIWMRQLIVGSDGVRGRYGADSGGHGGQGARVVDEKVSVVRQGVRTCGSSAGARIPDPAQVLSFYPCWIFTGTEVNKGDRQSLSH